VSIELKFNYFKERVNVEFLTITLLSSSDH